MFHGTKVPRELKFSLWTFRSHEALLPMSDGSAWGLKYLAAIGQLFLRG